VSHNKPIGCGASGAYAPGPDEEEEVSRLKFFLFLVIQIILVGKTCYQGFEIQDLKGKE